MEAEEKQIIREGEGESERERNKEGKKTKGKMIFYQQNSRDKFEFISLEMSPSYANSAWSQC